MKENAMTINTQSNVSLVVTTLGAKNYPDFFDSFKTVRILTFKKSKNSPVEQAEII